MKTHIQPRVGRVCYHMVMITWTNDTRKLSELVEWKSNPREITPDQEPHLTESVRKFGLALPFLISPNDDLYDGHQRKKLLAFMEEFGVDVDVPVRVSHRTLTVDERRELVMRLHENTGQWKFAELGNVYESTELEAWGFPADQLERVGHMNTEIDFGSFGTADHFTPLYRVVVHGLSLADADELAAKIGGTVEQYRAKLTVPT